MAESRMKEVAQELLRIAKEGKAKWEERTPNSYKVIFRGITLVIFRSGASDYLLTLMNEKGEDIDSLYADTGDRDSPSYPILREIYQLARGYAPDADVSTALEVLRST